MPKVVGFDENIAKRETVISAVQSTCIMKMK